MRRARARIASVAIRPRPWIALCGSSFDGPSVRFDRDGHQRSARRANSDTSGDMKKSLQSGISRAESIVVDRDRTIGFLGEELCVYSTPSMVGDVEHVALRLV